MPDDDTSSPTSDPMLGNKATDLVNLAMNPDLTPAPDPRNWQPPTPEALQAMLPGYEVQQFIARGGMGAVYRGVQTSLGRSVAIKILPPALREDEPHFAERFKQEGRSMAQLNHPGIVSVYDFGEMPDGTLYFIMEFIDGTDVGQMVLQQGRLSSAHAMAITAHVCDALQYAHEHGVVHRDIKPANIMVGYDGRVKVADFGLAKNAQQMDMSLTQSGHVMGTPHFVAPEALTLGLTVDHRADIYAVGVMLYQMLTGKLPQGLFEMPSLKVPGLDPRYDAIVAGAMREDREQRYQRIKDMRRALDAILTQPVVKSEVAKQTIPPAVVVAKSAQPQRPAGQPYRPPQRRAPAPPKRRSSSGWVAAVVIVAALAGSILWMNQSKENLVSGPPLPSPIARFTFDGASPEPGADIRNAPQHDGVLELDGSYEHDAADKKNARAIFRTPDLDYRVFTVAARLRPDDISGRNSALIFGGTSRWLGLSVDPYGNILVGIDNNKYHYLVPVVTINTGEWTALVVSLDATARNLAVYVNGISAMKIKLPDDWDFDVATRSYGEEDKKWTFMNYGNAGRLKGAVDELVVFNSILSDDEVAQLSRGLHHKERLTFVQNSAILERTPQWSLDAPGLKWVDGLSAYWAGDWKNPAAFSREKGDAIRVLRDDPFWPMDPKSPPMHDLIVRVFWQAPFKGVSLLTHSKTDTAVISKSNPMGIQHGYCYYVSGDPAEKSVSGYNNGNFQAGGGGIVRPDIDWSIPHTMEFKVVGDHITVALDGKTWSDGSWGTEYYKSAISPEGALQFFAVKDTVILKFEYADLTPPAPVATATKDNPFTNSLGMKFVPVPETDVLFCIHETRYKDWEAYASDVKNVDPRWKGYVNFEGYVISDRMDDHPVKNVTWDDSVDFCQWLSKKEGKTYRLPTDKEWSYAVGIGHKENWTQGATPENRNGQLNDDFPWGTEWPPPRGSGNFSDSTFKVTFHAEKVVEGYDDGYPGTAPVMTFKPNRLGLYDMAGNVWEWVDDWWNDEHKNRTFRGSAWFTNDREYLRSSARGHLEPSTFYGNANGGFRCVLVEEKGR